VQPNALGCVITDMNSTRTRTAAGAIALLLALALGLGYNPPSQRQAQADVHLRDAILHNDTRGVMEALAQRANPNATYVFASPDDRNLTLWQRTKRIYYHDLPDPPMVESPLALAVVGNNYQFPPQNTAIVEALLDRGANSNDPAPSMGSLVTNTSMMNRPATISLLLRYGADPSVRDFNGNTALMEAAQCGQLAVAETLLKHGVDVNCRGTRGQQSLTPLMSAFINDPSVVNPRTGRLPMMRLLLQHGADSSLKDDQGETALMLARRRLATCSFESQATLGLVIVLLQAAQAKAKVAVTK
jgi:hypothetical protein